MTANMRLESQILMGNLVETLVSEKFDSAVEMVI